MTDDEKDELDLLTGAADDWYGIHEAKEELRDLQRAKGAICRLFQKELISFWWYDSWAGPNKPRELNGEELASTVINLEQDKWWDAGDYMKAGYYAYSATGKGIDHLLTDPEVRNYFRNDWRTRAIARGTLYISPQTNEP